MRSKSQADDESIREFFWVLRATLNLVLWIVVISVLAVFACVLQLARGLDCGNAGFAALLFSAVYKFRVSSTRCRLGLLELVWLE